MSGFFEDDKVMFIPLSIDNTETKRTGYFFSNTKVVYMAVALVPLFFMLYPMLQGGVRLLPIIIVISVYAFIYTFFFRYVILEENRLRKDIRELDNNRYSGIDYFWGINKIGTKGDLNGVINYEMRSGKGSKEIGLIVGFERGSIVGVPDGNYKRFRESKQKFMRELAKQELSFRWYEIPIRPEMPPTFINYFNMMKDIKNPYLKKLIKLQLDINTLFVMDSEERFVDYVLILNSKLSRMKTFRNVVQSIIDTSLSSNGYIVNPRILNKEEIDKFFAEILFIDSLDSDLIRRGANNVDFSTFAKVVRIIDKDGREVNVDFAEDELDIDALTEFGESLDDDLERDEQLILSRRKDIDRRKEQALERLAQGRVKDRMTNKDYLEKIKETEQAFEEEYEQLEQYGWNYKAIIETQKREARRAEKRGDREAEKEILNRDMYIDSTESDIEIRTKQQLVIKEDKPKIDIDDLDDDLDLDDLSEIYDPDDDLDLDDLLDDDD